MDIRTWVIFGLCSALLAGPVMAGELEGRWGVDPAASKTSFLVRTTLHNVHGDTDVVPGDIDLAAGGGDVVFPVRGLKTHNNARDRNMYAMFEESLYPRIVYHISAVSVDEAKKTAAVRGTLSIHGVTRDFPLAATVTDEDGVLVLGGTADVGLKDFSLKAPGVLGLIRVADTVTVRYAIGLKRAR